MLKDLFKRKDLDAILLDAEKGEFHLKRALGPVDLIALGIGAIIGSGIFATVGTAVAGDATRLGAGPAIILSFVLTAVACAFCGLCYAEFTSLVPISGSAYTYSYATLGELIAWIIGWDLIIEYAVGNVAVAIAWAAYFHQLCQGLGWNIPAWLSVDYRSAVQAASLVADAGGKIDPNIALAYQAWLDHPTIAGIPFIFNFLAIAIVMGVTWLLVVGVKESARANNVMVLIKLAILAFFVYSGWKYVKPELWSPFMPNGFGGVWVGASLIFFAYIGFDAISTAAEECKNPGRDMPLGIIGSLVICTIIYVVVAGVLTGMVPWQQLGVADPLSAAFAFVHADMSAGIIALGAVVAMTAVLLVFQYGQPRIFFSMSRDGLLPPFFARVHPKYQTPHITTIWTGVVVAAISAVANIDEIVQLTNIGTLFAFVLVCAGIIVLRKRDPDRPRKFKTPLVPWIPLLGILSCFYLMAGLPMVTWRRFGIWLELGLVIYTFYGLKYSRAQAAPADRTEKKMQDFGSGLEAWYLVNVFINCGLLLYLVITQIELFPFASLFEHTAFFQRYVILGAVSLGVIGVLAWFGWYILQWMIGNLRTFSRGWYLWFLLWPLAAIPASWMIWTGVGEDQWSVFHIGETLVPIAFLAFMYVSLLHADLRRRFLGNRPA